MRANPVINPHATRFTSRPRAAVRSAFTLIELLLVLVILALLAAVVVPKMTGRAEDAKIKTTRTQIDSFKTALGTFEVDNGRYPTADEGLGALVTRPANLDDWKGYMNSLPLDAWQHPFQYRIPGKDGKDFDVYSFGPDGQADTADDIYAP